MRQLVLAASPTPVLAAESNPFVNPSRRGFIKAAGVFAAALAVAPKVALANASYESTEWKQLVINLVYAVGDQRFAQRTADSIRSCSLYSAPTPTNFHEQFSANLILGLRVYPERVGERYFEIDRFPFFDTENPCRRYKDLNVREIRQIVTPDEIDTFGTVVSPCNQRQAPDMAYYDHFRRAAEDYDSDPREWNWEYSRPFNNGKKSFLAHGVSHRTSRDSSGRPHKALLLSSEDI